MIITEIKLRRYFPGEQLEAIYSITFDNELVIHDVKLVRRNNELIMVMPSRQLSDGTRKDTVHPINKTFREKIESQLMRFHKYTVTSEENIKN